MASYASNTSGKARARAWLGADYAGESVRLKEGKASKLTEYAEALDEAWAEQKRIEKEEAAARTDENDSFGEYLWEFVQVVTALAVGASDFLVGNWSFSTAFATYQGLQEIEEGWYDYAESEALNKIDTSHLQEMVTDLKNYNWDLGALDKKYANLNSAIWEATSDKSGDAQANVLDVWLNAAETGFIDKVEAKDAGKWYDFAGDALLDAGASAASSYMASYAIGGLADKGLAAIGSQGTNVAYQGSGLT